MRMHYFLLVAILLITSIPGASAAEWDNFKVYDRFSNTMTISNWLGLGAEIAKVKLITPQVNYVMPGKNRLVAEFEIQSNGYYELPLKELELYSTSNMKPISKDITYKIKEKYFVDTGDYKEECDEKTLINGTINQIDCKQILIGTKQEERYRWVEWNKETIGAETVNVGLFTDVNEGETVEWIQHGFGTRWDEWAVWTAGLNVKLLGYWNMTNSSDIGIEIISGKNNITTNAARFPLNAGLIGHGLNRTASSFANISDNVEVGDFNVNTTLNFWFKSDVFGTGQTIIDKYQGAANGWYIASQAADATKLFAGGWAGSITSAANLLYVGSWNMITMTRNDSAVTLYFNGTNVGSTNTVANIESTWEMMLGDTRAASSDFVGTYDEMGWWNRTLTDAEITQLFNDGAGMTYTTSFGIPMSATITLDYPANWMNSSSASFTQKFNSSETVTMGNFTNSTVYIWNSTPVLINRTTVSISGNTTNYTNIDVVFASLPDGLYNWSIGACFYNETLSICNSSINRTFRVDTSAPAISIALPGNTVNMPPENVSLNYSAYDAGVGVQACWYSYNGGANVSIGSCANTSLYINKLGNNTIRIYANDTIGNVNSTFKSFVALPFFNNSCGININQETLNFTTRYEENLSILNQTTLAGSFTYWAESVNYNRTQAVSMSDDGAGVFKFCISPNWTTINMTASMQFSRNSFNTKYYYLTTAPLSNASTNINVYMSNTSDATPLVVRVLDSDLVPQEEVIVSMQRYYPATNTWLQVEMGETDSLGQTIMHITELTVKYKFILQQNGAVVYTTSPMQIVCYDDPCEIELTIPSEADDIFKYYLGVSGLSYALSFNETTSIVTFVYADTTGLTNQMRLNVQQINITTNKTVCDSTSAVAASGTLTCNLSGKTGTFFAKAYRTASPENILDRLIITIGNLASIFGEEAMVWTALFTITLVMCMIWNPAAAVGMGIFGIVMVGIFGFASLSYAFIISALVIGGIVISQLKT